MIFESETMGLLRIDESERWAKALGSNELAPRSYRYFTAPTPVASLLSRTSKPHHTSSRNVMLPPIDPVVLQRNPNFEILYKDLCTRKLNPNSSSRDTKKQRVHDEIRKVRVSSFSLLRRHSICYYTRNLCFRHAIRQSNPLFVYSPGIMPLLNHKVIFDISLQTFGLYTRLWVGIDHTY